jgi:hypothetical protein
MRLDESLSGLLRARLRAGESDPESERISPESDFSFEGRPSMSSEDPSADRIAVLVVHGVAAKVPNREFVNLEAITDLLAFQDQAQLKASYRLNQQSMVKFDFNGLHPLAPQPPTRTRDAGILYTKKLVSHFENQPYPYTTRRNELTRDPGENAPKTDVHVHEFFWADLSRPASLTGLHSISAFLRLIYSICILGLKSLPRESMTHRAGLRRSYRFLFGIEFVISGMTRLYIPIVATAFLAGIIALYVLLSLAAALCGKVSVDLPLGRLDARASRSETQSTTPDRLLDERLRRWRLHRPQLVASS